MSILEAALKKEKLKLQADTLPKEQRTVKTFQRLIAAMRACEAEVQERLSASERALNESLQNNIELQGRVHHLEGELMKCRLKEQLDGISELSVSDRTKLLSVSESNGSQRPL